MEQEVKPRFPNNKPGELTEKEMTKIVEQAKEILKEMYINPDVFEYEAEPDLIIDENEIMTIMVLVKKDGRIFYQLSEVYVDDDMGFLQYHMYIG